MIKRVAALLVLILASAGAGPTTRDDVKEAFQLAIASGPSTTWTIEAFKTKFSAQTKSITFTSHGQSHTADAVPLLTVLTDAGAPTTWKMDSKADPKTKNWPLRQTVLITGRDGYQAALALAEILPEFGNHEAWLAFDRDGQPLDDRSAPVELIVPGDVKPGRWVRGVVNIFVQPAAPSTQP
jgi:hypothetical protein